jgi:ring-1,2-phenylacetyl-CoA epoxidase subunit PaaE
MPNQYTLKIAEKVYETDDTVTIKFRQPGLKKVKYKSGQYITLIARVKGRTYRRPYSLSSVYGLDATLDITVKAIQSGIVSNYLFHEAAVDDVMEVIEPMGGFVLPESLSNKTIFFWSAGSGITPAWSMIREVLYKKEDIEPILVYCNRNKSSIIFNDNIETLQRQFNDRFRVYHKLSKPEKYDDNYFFEGRISRHSIHKLISHYPLLKSSSHFICGPVEMMDLIKEELFLLGVEGDKIFTENFHNTVAEKDLVGVTGASVTLEFENKIFNFNVGQGKTILDSCLDAGIDFPYSCQTGSCTFCKAILLKGAIKTITHQKPEKELQPDEYLTCCGYPLQNELFLKAN